MRTATAQSEPPANDGCGTRGPYMRARCSKEAWTPPRQQARAPPSGVFVVFVTLHNEPCRPRPEAVAPAGARIATLPPGVTDDLRAALPSPVDVPKILGID